MDFNKIDPKKLPVIINAIGVIVMLVWGVLGNGWGQSWIAVAISGVISGVVYYLFGNDEKKE